MNSAIAWRTPEDVLDEWTTRFGLGEHVSVKALEPHFDALEQELNAHAVSDDVLGENNRLFLDEAAKDGAAGAQMQRYERGCRGSGRCVTGCPSAAKQGMNVSYVPWALGARGAHLRVVPRRARRSSRAAGRPACSPRRGPRGPARTCALRARRGVLVAASTVQTPNILRRSGLRSRAIGEHFQCHPGSGVGGFFDSPSR